MRILEGVVFVCEGVFVGGFSKFEVSFEVCLLLMFKFYGAILFVDVGVVGADANLFE